VLPAEQLEALAREILATPRGKVLDWAEGRLRQGLDWRDLEAAVFLAGVLEIEPRPVGFRLHAVLVVESVYQLAERSPARERLFPVLFNLDDVKASQGADAERGDWKLPKRPSVTLTNADAGRAELAAALEAIDGERADRAVTALLTSASLADVFEVLFRRAIGDFGHIGHKVIYAAHAERTLRRIGAAAAEPALRSLVYGLTDPSTASEREDFGESRELVKQLPAANPKAVAGPEMSLTLSRAFLAGSPAHARAKLLEALREGADAAVAWDAVRLAACELFARAPALLPVHATTVANSLYYIHRTAREDLTRSIALFQGASWIPRVRDALVSFANVPREGKALDELMDSPPMAPKTVVPKEAAPEPLADLLVKPNPKRVSAYLAAGGNLDAFEGGLRTNLYRAVNQSHQPKYAAAILEDAAACHPRWRPVLLAPAFGYLPSGAAAESALYTRSAEIVKRVSEK
jgi:hypothetical protein